MRPPAAAARALRSEAPRVSAARSRLAPALPMGTRPRHSPGAPRGRCILTGARPFGCKIRQPAATRGVRVHPRAWGVLCHGRPRVQGSAPVLVKVPVREPTARHRLERAARKWERSAQHGGGTGPTFTGISARACSLPTPRCASATSLPASAAQPPPGDTAEAGGSTCHTQGCYLSAVLIARC